MTNQLNKQHILEAIDKLRSRKSRPDVSRIVSYVSKRYDFPKNEIEDYLEMLSKDGTVLKVEFKGNISYRNAAKCRNSVWKSMQAGLVGEDSYDQNSVSDMITGTIAELIVQEPDYLDVGISLKQLFKQVGVRYKKHQLTKNSFKEILQKEVENGNLVKFENGNYCLGYPTGLSMSPTVSETSANSNEEPSADAESRPSPSPVSTPVKLTPSSRQPSPSPSKSSSTSSFIMNEKPKVKKPPAKTYKKQAKKAENKNEHPEMEVDEKEKVGSKEELTEHCSEIKEVEKEKVDSPSVREASRRKRFQKIVFDPSYDPKPKKLKEKEKDSTPVSAPPPTPPAKKLRNSNKKNVKEVAETTPEKSSKKENPVQKASPAQPKPDPIVKDEVEVKADFRIKSETGENEIENESSQNSSNCTLCLVDVDFSSNDPWAACHVCDRKAHVSCIEDTEHWTRFKLSKWQCNDCKSCVACKGGKESNEVGLILCGLCEDAYHIKCAKIKKSKTTQKWFCSKCAGVFDSDEIKTEKDEFESVGATTSNESSQRTTPEPSDDKKTPEKEPSSGRSSRRSRQQSEDSKEDIDESIPDCSNWTCEDVYLYFLKYVLPEEANVFRDQEIDGRVLLLLTRYDVLSDFKLKLGPALKIYAQVKKLQVRKNDPQLLWP